MQALVRAMQTFVGAGVIAEGVPLLDDLELLARAAPSVLVQGNAVGRPGRAWPAIAAQAARLLEPRSARTGVIALDAASLA